jgi:Tfp pilus assembly protein PilX
MNTQPALSHMRMPRRERGTMLIIALIVLVAMTLAGIATMRSVDTASMMAGNIAFRQSAVNAADQGLQAGYNLLKANLGGNLVKDSSEWPTPAAGYHSSAPKDEPKWSDPLTWTTYNTATLNSGTPDAAGNVVSYVIQRLCPVPGCAPGAICGGNPTNSCGSTPDPSTLSSEGQDQTRPTSAFTKPPSYHYRITARAVGPRNSVSIVQATLRAY